ncbi:hypothetical protein [Micromonospora fulviviridis]|uniref:Uncharacterized protein n=1 Tax=Micromonospora fulviviridis TaxID=47860 RepID=A0ABV2VW29_9ACTN
MATSKTTRPGGCPVWISLVIVSAQVHYRQASMVASEVHAGVVSDKTYRAVGEHLDGRGAVNDFVVGDWQSDVPRRVKHDVEGDGAARDTAVLEWCAVLRPRKVSTFSGRVVQGFVD